MTMSLDRDGLHRMLWRRGNRNGKITFRLEELADELGVSRFTISRVMAEFMAENRVFKLSAPRRAGCTYRVADPDEWATSARSQP